MPHALWTLLRLHFRATFRRMIRGGRTRKGRQFMIFGVVALSAWLGPSIYRAAKATPADPRLVRTIAPFAILAFSLGNLIASFGENSVAFTAAEVDFLFPGPFSRRSLLGYKIIKSALGTIVTAVILTLSLIRYTGGGVRCCIGIWLTIQFMQLSAMAIMMIGQTVGARVSSAGRRGVLLVVLAMAVIAAAPKVAGGLERGPVEFLSQVHATIAGKVLLAPFDVFTRAITARSFFPELALWGTGALLIDLLMLAVVLGLDANYLETAAVASQRRYERLSRMRAGGAGRLGGVSNSGVRIRGLPWLGGIGPIAWRQLTGTVRSSRGLLVLIVIIVGVAGSIILKHRGESAPSLPPIIGAVIWMNLLFVSMLKFDFRDEIDRMDLLRSLPIRPAAVAAGELVAPVVILTAIQVLLLTAVGLSIKGTRQLVVPALAFALPLNVLLVGLENLLFLHFPLRAAGLIAGDMQLFGRQMVVFLCKFVLLLIALTVSSLIGVVGFFSAGRSWVVAGTLTWLSVCAFALGTIPLMARAYASFDPSVDTPT